MYKEKIPKTTIYRLAIYLRTLEKISREPRIFISSQEMGTLCGIDSAQVRKDLSYFGQFGEVGRGYSVKNLMDNLKKILKLYRRRWKVALAGVGSVFGHSNARVARMLGAKVILISSGGIGRPIDEIVLNRSLFEKEKADCLGVIINKVLKEKYEKIAKIVRLGLKRQNINELGIIPYNPILSAPTIEQISEEMQLPFLGGEEKKSNLVEKIIIGAMEPHEALKYIHKNTLVVTPGDREDIILAAIGSHLIPDSRSQTSIAGILLTGGIVPDSRILNMIKRVKIPLLISGEDTYTTTSKLHDLSVKLRPCDVNKIQLIKDMVAQYVDIAGLLEYV